jgi:hypothetical protein
LELWQPFIPGNDVPRAASSRASLQILHIQESENDQLQLGGEHQNVGGIDVQGLLLEEAEKFRDEGILYNYTRGIRNPLVCLVIFWRERRKWYFFFVMCSGTRRFSSRREGRMGRRRCLRGGRGRKGLHKLASPLLSETLQLIRVRALFQKRPLAPVTISASSPLRRVHCCTVNIYTRKVIYTR